MKKYKLFTLLALAFFSFLNADAQFNAEKTVELTGKSKNKGYLGSVATDDSKQQFDLFFVTKSNNRKVKFDVYTFDYNLALINTVSDEQEVKNARTKYRWFKYNGDGEKDEESYEGITAERNMMGKLVLKKILTVKKFNWWTGNYEYETRQLEKVKPTTIDEDGKKRKLTYIAHQDISSTGDLLVMALENRGIMNMVKSGDRNYLMLRYNKDLQVVEENSILFTTPQNLVCKGSVPGEDVDGDFDNVYVFSPMGANGYQKIMDPVSTNFTYVRTNAAGKVKERFNFQSKCNFWAVMEIAYHGKDVYLYGPGNIDKPEKNYGEFPYTITVGGGGSLTAEDARETMVEDKRFDYLQIMKVSNGKLAFLKEISIENINAKAMKPAEQAKLYAFDGKRFILSNINVTKSGDLFIDGQDFRKSKDGVRVYKDLLMFHFDKEGNFKRFYGIENTAKTRLRAIANAKAHPSRSMLTESQDGKSLAWNIFLVKDVDEDCSTSTNGNTQTTTCFYTPLFQGRVGKIDVSSGSISDFKTYGGEDFYLYMDVENDKGIKEPGFFINGGKEAIFLARQRKGGYTGTERWGNSIWFGKFSPDKF